MLLGVHGGMGPWGEPSWLEVVVLQCRSLEEGSTSCSAGRQVKRRNGLHGNRVRVAVYAPHGMFKRTLYVQVDDGWSKKVSWACPWGHHGPGSLAELVRMFYRLCVRNQDHGHAIGLTAPAAGPLQVRSSRHASKQASEAP